MKPAGVAVDKIKYVMVIEKADKTNYQRQAEVDITRLPQQSLELAQNEIVKSPIWEEPLVAAEKLRVPIRKASGGTLHDISWARSLHFVPPSSPPQANSYI